MNNRWCIYIDVLGFSDLWEGENLAAVSSLRELIHAIYRIGTKVYPDESNRLFVHQMGDGFAIVSHFNEPMLERPLTIAMALMRCIASTGTLAAAAVAEGKFSDISGCYPREVTDELDEAGVVMLGSGLMTLTSVMGNAFIRPYRLNNDAPPGPFLTVADCSRNRVPSCLPVRKTESRKGAQLLAIDWVRGETALLSDVQRIADLNTPSQHVLLQTIQEYCARYSPIREKWGRNLRDLLDIEV